MKTALITGVTGQDGAYLAELLLKKGYNVFGTYRRLSTPNFWRLQHLNVFDKIDLIPIDLIDTGSILESIKMSNPDEIYHMAAQSFVGASFEQPISTGMITGLGTARLLEAMRTLGSNAKFYNAATSELYGTVNVEPQNENTPFHPASPYAVAKLYSYWITSNYRNGYDMFAANGILFNHESSLRGLEFVTRKISNSVAKIKLGIEKTLEIGNLETKRDWGFAQEYVEAMWMMLQQEKPDDFVIATNEMHSVKDFVENAFNTVGLNWEDHVTINKRFKRPLETGNLRGDYTKAKEKLGWEPKTKFKELVKMMVEEDVKRWEMWLNGKSFPWDAPNYPNESRILSRSLKLEKL
ncbi:MAG: GDP-mannose 4,6-dehydratase [Candidatus Aenigmarchaeota archaeon]|nr:GDP-mannose 4,6-dehydratase [Candidatus Aenigmarchaeota archaeon]